MQPNPVNILWRFENEKKQFKGEKMVFLDKLCDDVIAGSHPDKGLGKLRKGPLVVHIGGEAGEGSSKFQRSLSMSGTPTTPGTPVTPTSPSPTARKDNVWRSVFNPGSNLATRGIGAHVFDKPSQPNSPTVYDWLYSGETRSKHQ